MLTCSELVTELGMSVSKVLDLFFGETNEAVIAFTTVALVVLILEVQSATTSKEEDEDSSSQIDRVTLVEVGRVLREVGPDTELKEHSVSRL
jgi:hypothetical protein